LDIDGWFREIGLGQYGEIFRANDIDGELLGRLTNDDLKDIGVASLGHRKKLLEAIAALAAAPDAAPATRVAAAEPKTPDGAERRHLAVLFCDLVGSTSISAALDAEDWRDLVGGYLDAASEAVAQMGGHVAKKLGDGLMALFGHPIAQENDAERAVRAALAIQLALAELNRKNLGSVRPELVARIGIAAGAVVVDSSGEIFGDAPNIAARVQALAEPGTVLITARVQRQVAGLFVAEDRGAQTLKGVAEPTTLYRIVRASGAGRRSGQRALTPLVGRDEEVTMLLRRWERARAGEGQFVMIVGEPGLGKSRLIEEFHTRLADTPHTWVEWSSSQLLQNTPLHPIAEWGRQRFGGADVAPERRLADLESSLGQVKLDPAENVPLLAPLVDIPLPPERAANLAPEELRRRQMAALNAWVMAGARTQALVLAFEDLHWADPTTLDVLRGFAERGALAPLLVLATTRPEFRAPWGARSHHGTITLSPLDRAQIRQMVGELAQRHALSRDVIEGVGERTGGVPLFIEEVTRLLLERGEQGGAQAIPPTLQQSLAARLDRLGPARDVAMIGAVLGRDFSFSLLRAVAGMEDAPLQQALDKLAEADILLVEGLPPEATYRFKHALIQDAAYENLLKSRRQALHRRVAETLRDQFPDRADAEPEALAHHFTQAGLTDAAIEYWGKAGDQALRRSAFQEAIAHLGKAIAMADKGGDGATLRGGGRGDRLRLQTAYGNALISARGYQAPETSGAFARGRELAAGIKDAAEPFSLYYGVWAGSFVRGDLGSMREVVPALLEACESRPDLPEAGIAHRLNGETCWFEGHFEKARIHLERALAILNPDRDRDLAFRFGQDAVVTATAFLAYVLWPLGEIDRARQLADEMVERATESGHVATIVWARFMRAGFALMLRNAADAAAHVTVLVDLARAHEMTLWMSFGAVLEPWVRSHLGDRDAPLAEMRRGIAMLREQGVALYIPIFETALAELEAETGQLNAALVSLDRAVAETARTGQRWFEAETQGIRGDILLKADPKNPARAEEAYLAAIAIAREQGARSFGLQAALKLAKLYQSTGRPVEAHDALAPALEGFSPTPEMPEIAEAQALLAALQETDEVKADAAQRRRMTHLRVAYGNALIAARGFGAPETTEAFARARKSAPNELDAPERLAADFGLWAGSFTRGELLSMRALAAAFVAGVQERPDSAEAGVAHRLLGATHWFAGEYVQARDHLERALALFQPVRDDDLTFRFGQDAGVAAMLALAFTLWPLGDVERAISLVGGAEARIAGLAHIGTHAFARMRAAAFELMRGDLSRAAPTAAELARLAHEHDLPLWRAYGIFLEGFATAESGAPGGGLADMRRGVELLRDQNALYFDGLIKIALAEGEARTGDVDRALTILDEALATSERIGHRAFDAELHRTRGEMLLKRDPANPAPAEEAMRTAIAIAKQQGTRSFELRAAVSLAKLYQSTGRPVEAHDALAPALEGFAPTPEMPEIAEAQTLLAALGETEEVKAEAALRNRRLQLQTAYGYAMLHGRGHPSLEMHAAFNRACELAAGVEDASERFSAYFGLWAGSFMGADLGSIRGASQALLRDAQNSTGSLDAAVAHRILGTTLWFQGDYAGARAELDQAFAAYDHERDRNLASRFGYDVGVQAEVVLALVLWALGQIDQSESVIQNGLSLAEQARHHPTVALAHFWATILAVVRCNPAHAKPHAEALLHLAREHGMPQWAAHATFLLGWTNWWTSRQDGEAGMREGLRLLQEKNIRHFGPLFGMLLAEVEAAEGRVEAGVATMDAQFAIVADSGEDWFLAEMHRRRGEILLKRDPANTAPAEEAFQAAIAIAQRQKARSFELGAALKLAKLYQSTGRPVEAHDALASALEGFAPTPEIAEAQALLAAVAETEEVKSAASQWGAAKFS